MNHNGQDQSTMVVDPPSNWLDRVDSPFLYRWTINLTIGLLALLQYLTQGLTPALSVGWAAKSTKNFACGSNVVPGPGTPAPFAASSAKKSTLP